MRGDNDGGDFRLNQTIQTSLEDQMRKISETLQRQQQLMMQVMGWAGGRGGMRDGPGVGQDRFFY